MEPPGAATASQSAGGWGFEQTIDTQDTVARLPRVVIDRVGRATAVWDQPDPGIARIWSSTQVPGAGWGTATAIDLRTGNSRNPVIGVGGEGNAVAVWILQPSTGSALEVWANRFAVGTGWEDPQRVLEGAGNLQPPDVSVAANGTAIAVWGQSNMSLEFEGIWTSRFEPGSAWSPPEQRSDGFGHNAKIGMDDSENAVAAWILSDTSNDVYAARYVAPDWSTAGSIEFDGGHIELLELAVSASGRAVAVWQSSGTRTDVWANVFE